MAAQRRPTGGSTGRGRTESRLRSRAEFSERGWPRARSRLPPACSKGRQRPCGRSENRRTYRFIQCVQCRARGVSVGRERRGLRPDLNRAINLAQLEERDRLIPGPPGPQNPFHALSLLSPRFGPVFATNLAKGEIKGRKSGPLTSKYPILMVSAEGIEPSTY